MTTFFVAVRQHCRFAVASVASCLGACLAVWVSGVYTCGVCIARVSLLLIVLAWICNACIITTSELFVFAAVHQMLLAELGLLPLQVFWWRQTLEFWNSLAALPVGSLYHAVCLDKLTDAFRGGACNLSSSLASCLHLVGYDMPRVHDVIPILDVDNIVGVLTEHLQGMGSGTLYCCRVAPPWGVVSCTYQQCTWFRPYSLRRRYCHLPVSGRHMQRFLQFRLGCHGLPVSAGRFAGAAHVDKLRGCACFATVVLWGMRGIYL